MAEAGFAGVAKRDTSFGASVIVGRRAADHVS